MFIISNFGEKDVEEVLSINLKRLDISNGLKTYDAITGERMRLVDSKLKLLMRKRGLRLIVVSGKINPKERHR